MSNDFKSFGFGGSVVSKGNKNKIDKKNINLMLIKMCDLGYFENFGFVNREGVKDDMLKISNSIEVIEDMFIENRRVKNGIDVSVSFGSNSGSMFKNWIKKNGFEDYEIEVNMNKEIKVSKI